MTSSRTRDPLIPLAVICAVLAGILLLFSRIAHAAVAGPATTAAPGIDWNFWTGVLLAIATAGSYILHALAAKRHSATLEAIATDIDTVRLMAKGAPEMPLKLVKPAGGAGAGSMLVILLLGALATPALTGCTPAQRSTAATSAGRALVNCTAQQIGTTPGLDLATVLAIANKTVAERAKCTPAGGSLSWACVEADAIADGKVIGGCTLVQLIASATSKQTVASATAGPDPGRATLEDFRARVAPGVTYHTAAGDQ